MLLLVSFCRYIRHCSCTLENIQLHITFSSIIRKNNTKMSHAWHSFILFSRIICRFIRTFPSRRLPSSVSLVNFEHVIAGWVIFSVPYVISSIRACNSPNIWIKIFKNGQSKICGRQPLKNLNWKFKGCLPFNFTWPILENLDPYVISLSWIFLNCVRELALVVEPSVKTPQWKYFWKR